MSLYRAQHILRRRLEDHARTNETCEVIAEPDSPDDPDGTDRTGGFAYALLWFGFYLLMVVGYVTVLVVTVFLALSWYDPESPPLNNIIKV